MGVNDAPLPCSVPPLGGSGKGAHRECHGRWRPAMGVGSDPVGEPEGRCMIRGGRLARGAPLRGSSKADHGE
jgi:hypothetical protein